MKTFPFDLDVLVCDHVSRTKAAVLLVVRDEDDSWQFLCGGDHEDDQCDTTRVGTITGNDTSLNETSGLAIGAYAERASRDHPWQFGVMDA